MEIMEIQTTAATGTFAGHLYFGILLTAWALVWIGEALSSPSSDVDAPLERGRALPVLKMILPLVGAWFEIPNRGWPPAAFMMGWAHIAAYVPFALTGVVDLLANRHVVPVRAGYIAYTMVMLNAAFVFWAHDDHGGVPGSAHTLLVMLLVGTAAFSLYEVARPGPTAAWFRRGSLLTLGTFLLIMTWMLYRSGWDMMDPVRVGWTYALFSWNSIIIVTLVATVALIAGRRGHGDTE